MTGATGVLRYKVDNAKDSQGVTIILFVLFEVPQYGSSQHCVFLSGVNK